jgi:VWFA-related protein
MPGQRRRSDFLVAAVLMASSALLLAQPPASQPPLFRSGVDIVVVEAHVVDKSGALARGLTPADFQVTLGGRTRSVVTAELVEHENAPAVPVDADISTNVVRGAARTILVVVDQASLRPEGRAVLLTAAKWVSTLGPSDRVGLVTLPGGPRVEFTTEHQKIRDLLDQIVAAPTIKSLPATLRNVSTWEGLRISEGDMVVDQTVKDRECRRGGRGDPACIAEIQLAVSDIAIDAQYRVQAVLGPLRALMLGLRLLPGPKHVVLLSSGWPISERLVAQEMSSIAAEAALSNATVHSFTKEQWALEAATSRPSTTPAQDRMLLMSSVEMLSGATGGQATRLTDDGSIAFKALSTGLTGYYRLGVQAQAEDLDGRPRNISIKVTRPGVSLATYRKVMAGVRSEAPPSDPTEALQAAVGRAALTTDLDVRCTAYVLHDESNGRDELRVMVAGDVARASAGQAKMLAIVYDLDGKPVANGGQRLDVAVGVPARFHTVLKVKPGSYRVRVGVGDADGRIGTIERGVDARWLKAGNAETTGLVLYRLASTEGSAPEPLFETVAVGDRVVVQLALGVKTGDVPTRVLLELTKAGEAAPLLTKNATMGQTPAGVTLAQEALPARLLTKGQYTLAASILPGDVRLTRSFAVR